MDLSLHDRSDGKKPIPALQSHRLSEATGTESGNDFRFSMWWRENLPAGLRRRQGGRAWAEPLVQGVRGTATTPALGQRVSGRSVPGSGGARSEAKQAMKTPRPKAGARRVQTSGRPSGAPYGLDAPAGLWERLGSAGTGSFERLFQTPKAQLNSDGNWSYGWRPLQSSTTEASNR